MLSESKESDNKGSRSKPDGSEIIFSVPDDILSIYSNSYYVVSIVSPFDTSVDILLARYAQVDQFAQHGIPKEFASFPAKGQVIVKMPLDAALGMAQKIFEIVSALPKNYHEALGIKTEAEMKEEEGKEAT